MTYEVVFTGPARRALESLPAGVAWAVIEFCAGPLAENPYQVGKPLVGELLGLYSARREEYRLIYAIVDEQLVVEVVRIRHRGTAYRR